MADDSQVPWITLASTYSYIDEWLRLRSDSVRLPNGTVLTPFHTIEVPDSVNDVAITTQFTVLLIEQYRHSVHRTLAFGVQRKRAPHLERLFASLKCPGAFSPTGCSIRTRSSRKATNSPWTSWRCVV